MQKQKRIFVAGAVLAASLSIIPITAGVASAWGNSHGKAHEKVTLCHSDGSNDHGGSGKYSVINVNIASVADAQNAKGHNDHDHDIIPPYTYSGKDGSFSYPGKNWTSDNIKIYNNGCCKSHKETTTSSSSSTSTSTSTSTSSSTSSSTASSTSSSTSSTTVPKSTTSVPKSTTSMPSSSTTSHTTPSPKGSLPHTGSDTLPGLALAGVFIGGGTALAFGARSRKRQ